MRAAHRRRLVLVAAVVAGAALLAMRTALAKRVDGVVNLNTAPPDLLSLLPGVGPSKAESILLYRARRPFRTVDELVRVKGIGRRMVRELRGHLAVSGPSTLRAAGALAAAPTPPTPTGMVTPPRPPSVIPPRPAPRSGQVRGPPRPRADPWPRSAANHCAAPA